MQSEAGRFPNPDIRVTEKGGFHQFCKILNNKTFRCY